MPPDTFLPYWARIALYSCAVWLLSPLSGVSSAFTNSLWFHFGPSEVARKSVLHGVEQPQPLTRASRPSFWAGWRITSAPGGVKSSTPQPPEPALLTRSSATELPSLIGTFSV